MSDLSTLTAGTWNVDPAHSSVGFAARHLMVSKVRGSFGAFSGTITVGENPLESKVEASVDVTSVTTGDASRDGHLQSADFFDVATYPTMTLVSTGLSQDGDDFTLDADVTIKGVTKPVAFELEFEGIATDPWGNTKAGFSAEAEISRKEWGMDFNMALDTGGVLVGDKVKLQLDIQAVKV